MKKIKMMLLSLALFAIVGAALAFKARFTQEFCTATTVGVNACKTVACINHEINSVTDQSGAADFVCTTTYDGNGCQSGVLCTTTSTPLILDK